MLLIAALLGAAFAWIVETAWGMAYRSRTPIEQDHLKWLRRRGLKVIVLLLFLGVGLLYIAGIHGRFYAGDWSSRFVIALHYMTAPSVLGGLAAFVIGALCVWQRERLQSTLVWLKLHWLERPSAPPQPPTATQQADNSGKGAADRTDAKDASEQRGQGPYPWLARIVGIAAVTLVAVVTLVIFFPELLIRVESVKVAGVEARFAAAASRSIQVVVQVADSNRANDSILGWAEYENGARDFIAPVQRRVTGLAASDVYREGDYFLRNVAAPLARVLRCYAGEFQIRDTDMRHRVAKVTDEWGRVFEDKNGRLAEAVNQTYELIYQVERDLQDRASRCGRNVDPPKPIFEDLKCGSGCRKNDAFKNQVQPIIAALTPNIPHVKKNGLAISFLAHLFMLTHDAPRAAAFMDKMAAGLDTGRETLIAQIVFYNSRSEAKIGARALILEIDADLIRAVSLTDEALACINDTKARGCRDFGTQNPAPDPAGVKLSEAAEYHELARISFINNRLYILIAEWLGGRRLQPSELLLLEGAPAGGLAYEVSEWLKKQSLSALRDRGGAIAHTAIRTIAELNDTLAMREIAIGISKNDLTRDRCARIPGLLATAYDIFYRELPDNDQLRVAREHRNLYDSVCQ